MAGAHARESLVAADLADKSRSSSDDTGLSKKFVEELVSIHIFHVHRMDRHDVVRRCVGYNDYR